MTRTRIATGTGFPISSDPRVFCFCRPFTLQLDLVFPFDAGLQNVLSSIAKHYFVGKGTLLHIAKNYPPHLGLSILPVLEDSIVEDSNTWCIDHRGVLTMILDTSTYEKLGIVGERLPFKSSISPARHLIRLPLHDNSNKSGSAVITMRNNALRVFDELHQGQLCKVYATANGMYYAPSTLTLDAATLGLHELAARPIAIESTVLENIHLPHPRLLLPPEGGGEEKEDWQVEISELFEWTGLAALGSPRLSCTDQVDPYIAFYEPPANSTTADVAHLSFRGFLGPDFLETVIKTLMNHVSYSQLSLLAITGHSYLSSPVTYIKPSDSTPGKINASIREPFADFGQEDTWSLVLTPNHDESTSAKVWALAESIGAHDARFG